MSHAKSILFYSDDSSVHPRGAFNERLMEGMLDKGHPVVAVYPRGEAILEDASPHAGVVRRQLSYDPQSDLVRSFTETKEPQGIFAEFKPDLICFCDSTPVSNLAAKHAALAVNIPFVIFCHSAMPELAQRFAACTSIVRHHLEFAREVICLDGGTHEILRRSFGLASDKGCCAEQAASAAQIDKASYSASGGMPCERQATVNRIIAMLGPCFYPQVTQSRKPEAREAFVYRVNRDLSELALIVLTYVRIFISGAPVGLVLVLDPSLLGAAGARTIRDIVGRMVRLSGKRTFADIVIVSGEEELSKTLAAFTSIHPLPFDASGDALRSSAGTVYRAALRAGGPEDVMAPTSGKRRLLTLLDYAVQPYSIGDFIFYQMGSMVAAEAEGIDKVDLVILSDISRPHVDPVMRGWVTSKNHHARLMGILALIDLHPRLGSLTVFESIAELNAHLPKFASTRLMWPTGEMLNRNVYLSYDVLIMLKRFHESTGRVPLFRFGKEHEVWAKNLIAREAEGLVPVTINLRMNHSFGTHRNFDVAEWRGFFEFCKTAFPVKFFVIGSASEVEPSFRELPNVVFAKDHQSTLLQDLSLVQYAAFHLGCGSGPTAFVLFQEKPYHIFRNDMVPHLPKWGGSLILDENGELLCSFRRPFQTMGVIAETTEGIRAQFEKIWNSRDWISEWSRSTGKSQSAEVPV